MRQDYGVCAVFVKAYCPDKWRVSGRKVCSPSLKELGANIRRMRTAQGITQQQLAEAADLNIRNVQQIEAGEIDVLFSTLARIRKALNQPWDRLIPRNGQ